MKFLFNLEWNKAISCLDDKGQLMAYRAIFHYAEYGEEIPECHPMMRMFLMTVAAEMDKERTKYEKRCSTLKNARKSNPNHIKHQSRIDINSNQSDINTDFNSNQLLKRIDINSMDDESKIDNVQHIKDIDIAGRSEESSEYVIDSNSNQFRATEIPLKKEQKREKKQKRIDKKESVCIYNNISTHTIAGAREEGIGFSEDEVRKAEAEKTQDAPLGPPPAIDATKPSQGKRGAARPDFDAIAEFYNRTVDEKGSMLPKIKKLTEKRKGAINARVREHGLDAVYEAITKAAASFFLNGGGDRGWTADFDWIFSQTYFLKILEGNYDDPKESRGAAGGGFSETRISCQEAPRCYVADDESAALVKDVFWKNMTTTQTMLSGWGSNLMELQRVIEGIIAEWRCLNRTHKSLEDAQRHLVYYAKKILTNKQRYNNGTAYRNLSPDEARRKRDEEFAVFINELMRRPEPTEEELRAAATIWD